MKKRSYSWSRIEETHNNGVWRGSTVLAGIGENLITRPAENLTMENGRLVATPSTVVADGLRSRSQAESCLNMASRDGIKGEPQES